MSETIQCAICRQVVPRHDSYVVRIEVFADPSTPAMDSEGNPDPAGGITKLMDQLKHYSADELQDQVYRRFELHICGKCQPRYLVNPVGHRVDRCSRN